MLDSFSKLTVFYSLRNCFADLFHDYCLLILYSCYLCFGMHYLISVQLYLHLHLKCYRFSLFNFISIYMGFSVCICECLSLFVFLKVCMYIILVHIQIYSGILQSQATDELLLMNCNNTSKIY